MKGSGDFPSLNTKSADGVRANGTPYKILIVENKPFQLKQIAQILESERYIVSATAENGRMALDNLKNLDYDVDLITTNLDMPVLDGYALIYELKELGKKIPVVFISDETTTGVMKDLITMGISDFILKPINRRTLLDRIKKVITKIYG